MMVDERTTRMWSSSAVRDQRPDLAIRDFPEHAAVGLLVSRKDETDAVDDLVRRHAFQRACVELAAKRGNTVSGRIGEHGLTFLSTSRGSVEHSRRSLADLCERASLLASRRFGLRVHFGISTLPVTLPEQYQAAFTAAESALSGNISSSQAKRAARTKSPIGERREELVRLIVTEPNVVPGRFDRFLELVAVRTAHRWDLARIHLEVAFERLCQALQHAGGIEPRSLEPVARALETSVLEGQTLNELFAAYRRAIGDLVQAVQNPATARHERSLRRAEQFLREHYAEAVSLPQVARVAGFAPNYFSALFRQQHGVTFERHVMQLRLDRAKALLSDTRFNLQRIAQLSGFSRATYLSRIFKREIGKTPMDYRWKALYEPKGGRRRANRALER
jgi:AraC-like DNA-binding protein